MVKREQRDLAGRLVKQYFACEITNDDFVDAYPVREKDDRAIGAIYEVLWNFWDDRYTHTLTGKHKLKPEPRALFERCIAFFESDLEYEWPPLTWHSVSQLFLRLIGLRKIAERRSEEWMQKARSIGEFDVWPFIRKEDYDTLSHN